VNFVSLHDHIDTTTATGRFTFNIFASLAEFEREIIRERTKQTLLLLEQEEDWEEGQKGLSADKLQLALTDLDLHDTGKYSIAEIANRLQMLVATCYRYLKHVKAAKG